MIRSNPFRYDVQDHQNDSFIFLPGDIISMEQEKIPSTLRDVRWHTVTCTLSYTVNGVLRVILLVVVLYTLNLITHLNWFRNLE